MPFFNPGQNTVYTTFDHRRVDIINQVEYGVHDRLHIYPMVGYFTYTGIDTRRDQRLLVSLPKDTGKVG